MRRPRKTDPRLEPIVQLLLARDRPAGSRGREEHWWLGLSQHWLKFCTAAFMLPLRDCTAWLPRLGADVSEGVNHTIYILRNNTEYVKRAFHFIVDCIGLCISIRFLLIFLFLPVCCVQRGWHISLYRPLVLLFNTITGLIDFSTARPAQRGCGYVTWRMWRQSSKLSASAFTWFVTFGWFHFSDNEV